MVNHISLYFMAILAIIMVGFPVACEDNERPDILFIQNPDTFPMILSPDSPLLDAPRSNLVCTASMCSRVCWALNYRYGRCNINRVCVCSNF